MELNAQIQKELDAKDEIIRILEDKNAALTQTVDMRVDEIEILKQKMLMLEQEVCGLYN